MTLARVLPLFAGSLLAVASVAQTSPKSEPNAASQPERTFAVVEGSSMRTFQGGWHSSAALFRYVHDHPGTYVVFLQGGALYRLDKPEQMAEVERLYAPMKELSIRQEALAQVQKPLAENQRTLGSQQRATADPAEKGRIGEAQGAIGQEQGDIGAMQGQLGRQQGDVAKAAYRHMQALFDRCVADGSCSRITS